MIRKLLPALAFVWGCQSPLPTDNPKDSGGVGYENPRPLGASAPLGGGLAHITNGFQDPTAVACDSGTLPLWDAGGFFGCVATLPIPYGGTGLTSAGATGTYPRSNGTAWVEGTIQSSDISGLSPSFASLAIDGGSVTTCANAAHVVTNGCTLPISIPSSSWVTLFPVPASAVNVSTLVQATFVAGDYSFADGGQTNHNVTTCQTALVVITETDGGVYLNPGTSQMAASVPLLCTGLPSQVGCSSNIGDAGCVASTSNSVLQFQAIVDGGVYVQGAQLDGGTAAYRVTPTYQLTPVY